MLSTLEVEYSFDKPINGTVMEKKDLLDKEDTTPVKVYLPTLMTSVSKGNGPTDTNIPLNTSIFKSTKNGPSTSGVVTSVNYVSAKMSGGKPSYDVEQTSQKSIRYAFGKKKVPEVGYTIQKNITVECTFLGGLSNKLQYTITANDRTKVNPKVKVVYDKKDSSTDNKPLYVEKYVPLIDKTILIPNPKLNI